MRAFIFVFLIAAFARSALSEDEDPCNENTACPDDAPPICGFHPDLYCFLKFDNICQWNIAKCKYKFNFQVYALPFCDLENFVCSTKRHKYHEANSSFNI